jgi:hypothetical protein
MLGFEIREKLPCRANLPVFHVFESLANSFLHAGARGNIKEALIRLGVLHDGCCLAFHGEHHRALGSFKLWHEVAGPAAKLVMERSWS